MIFAQIANPKSKIVISPNKIKGETHFPRTLHKPHQTPLQGVDTRMGILV